MARSFPSFREPSIHGGQQRCSRARRTRKPAAGAPSGEGLRPAARKSPDGAPLRSEQSLEFGSDLRPVLRAQPPRGLRDPNPTRGSRRYHIVRQDRHQSMTVLRGSIREGDLFKVNAATTDGLCPTPTLAFENGTVRGHAIGGDGVSPNSSGLRSRSSGRSRAAGSLTRNAANPQGPTAGQGVIRQDSPVSEGQPPTTRLEPIERYLLQANQPGTSL